MMAVCQKHVSWWFLIEFGQDRIIFKDGLGNVFNLVKQSHWTLFLEGSPHGGQVDVVGEEKKQSCKIIFLINYFARQTFSREERRHRFPIAQFGFVLSKYNLHVLTALCSTSSCLIITDNHEDGNHEAAELQDLSRGAVGGGGVLAGLGRTVGGLLGGSVSRLGGSVSWLRLSVGWLRGAVPRGEGIYG